MNRGGASLARTVVVCGLAVQLVLTAVQVLRAAPGAEAWLHALAQGAGDAIGGAVALVLLALLIPFAWRGARWALVLSIVLQLGLVAGILPYLRVGFAHPEDFAAWLLNVTYLVIGLLAAGFGVVAALEAYGRARPAGWRSREAAAVAAVATLWLGMVVVGEAVAAAGAPAAGGALDTPADDVVVVRMGTMSFVPPRLSLQPRRSTAVVLVNESPVSHSFDVDPLGVHVRVPPHSTVTTLVPPHPAGPMPFYCGIPGHAEAGMRGEIVGESRRGEGE